MPLTKYGFNTQEKSQPENSKAERAAGKNPQEFLSTSATAALQNYTMPFVQDERSFLVYALVKSQQRRTTKDIFRGEFQKYLDADRLLILKRVKFQN